MKLVQSIQLPSGAVVPKGTELHFSTEGIGYFNGEKIYEKFVPDVAVECIIVGGFFGGDAVLAKNRDRMYMPVVGIKHEIKDDVEIAYIYDKDTGWREGLNALGIAIVNSALQVGFDEKEKKIVSETGKKSHDGAIITKALTAKNIDEAVSILTGYRGGVRGHTLVTDGKTFRTIESTSKHEHVVNEKPGDKPIVRTNHGYDYTDAGYQKGAPFVSSIVRRQQVLDNLETTDDVFDALSKSKYKQKDPKNVVRDTAKMKTTSQMKINASKKTLEFRPLAEKCDFIGVKTKLPENYKPIIQIII